MTTVTLSYSPTDGTILLGTSRGDGSNTVLKELHAGWRWYPPLNRWYVRGSRNKPADTLLIDLTKIALEDAGFTVNVDINDAELPTQTLATAPKTTPRVTPLNVAQRAKQRPEPTETMQVHIKSDGEIVLDLTNGDSQTAVDFIRKLLQPGKIKPSAQLSDSELRQIRQAPRDLGPKEAVVWTYLRSNDSREGVSVQNVREDLNLTDKAVAGTLHRLQRKGFATPVRFGRWRALDG